MVTEQRVIPIACADDAKPPRCTEFDDECCMVADKVSCWLYAPEEGYCPYLQTEEE